MFHIKPFFGNTGRERLIRSHSCCDIGHVDDVENIADMPIGRNAIIVDTVENKTLTSK